MNQYLKAIVAVLGAVLTALTTYYGHAQWLPVVSAGITAALVYLTPNQPPQPSSGSATNNRQDEVRP